VLGKTLDIEVKEWHEVVATCSDTGSPPLSSSDYFRLHVVDINDNAPEFTQAVYSIFLGKPLYLEIALHKLDLVYCLY
jgi:hypothetical protein